MGLSSFTTFASFSESFKLEIGGKAGSLSKGLLIGRKRRSSAKVPFLKKKRKRNSQRIIALFISKKKNMRKGSCVDDDFTPKCNVCFRHVKKKPISALSVHDNEILTSAPSSISAKIERMEREGVRTALVRS